jgi:hypothetical protein
VSVLYQGAPGSGKTYNMATWPSPFFLYFDTNLMGLAKFTGIPYVVVESWDELAKIWLPAIKNRRLSEYVSGMVEADGSRPFKDYRVRTLCLDSLTFQVNKTLLELEPGAGNDTRGMWGEYYSRIHTLLTVATQATLPVPRDASKECYHVLASVHEDTMTDSDGNLTAIKPSVQGKMRGHLTAYFNAVLLTESYIIPANESGPRRQDFRVWSLASNKLREAKDQVSGGRFGKLPPSCGGTFPELNKFWGLEPPAGPTP